MKERKKVPQSCLTFCDPMDYTVLGILQARIVEWPFPSPGDLPNPGTEPRSPALQADCLPAEPQGKPSKWKSQDLNSASLTLEPAFSTSIQASALQRGDKKFFWHHKKIKYINVEFQRWNHKVWIRPWNWQQSLYDPGIFWFEIRRLIISK